MLQRKASARSLLCASKAALAARRRPRQWPQSVRAAASSNGSLRSAASGRGGPSKIQIENQDGRTREELAGPSRDARGGAADQSDMGGARGERARRGESEGEAPAPATTERARSAAPRGSQITASATEQLLASDGCCSARVSSNGRGPQRPVRHAILT
jgi:hypothetical protein